MRLGATLHRYCNVRIDNPDAYLAECRKQGFRAAQSPDHRLGSSDDLRKIRDAFAAADVVIAEVGGWSNPLDPREEERCRAIATTCKALSVADELGALCCINVAGSFHAEKSYAYHPDNFSETAFDAVVQWVRQVLREVRPRRTKLTIESSPWTPIDSPASYARLLLAVDDPGFAVHLDPVNFVLDARTYATTTSLLNEVFDRFGSQIVSCHAKDIVQGDPKTVQLAEALPGQGVLDYRTYLRRMERISPQMPLIIEHLTTEAEYTEAARFIRSVARQIATADEAVPQS